MPIVSERANQILETAIESQDFGVRALIVDRAGHINMIDAATWSLPSIVCEFGGSEIYLIERRADFARVEGWSLSGSCLLQRQLVN